MSLFWIINLRYTKLTWSIWYWAYFYMKRGAKNQGDRRFLEEQAPLVAMADGRRRASTVRQACARPRLVREHAKRYEADRRHVRQRTGSRTRWIARKAYPPARRPPPAGTVAARL